MKIKFLLWYVFFSLWLMGCRDAESGIDYKQNVSVRLSMDAAATRGVSALPAVDGYHLRYVLGIYKQNEADGTLTLIQRIPQTTSDFNLDLATDETFTLVAWADFVSSGTDNSTLTSVEDEFYNTQSLQNVSIMKEKWVLNTPARDAFCAKAADVTSSALQVTMTLKRPFALMNVKGSYAGVQSAKVTYPSVYTAYDVTKGDITGTASEQILSAKTLSADANQVLIFDYLFTHPLADGASYQEGSILYDVNLDFFASDNATGEALKSFKVDYVPFTANYKTNLICPVENTSSVQVTCSIDADFETPEVDGDKPFIVSSYIRGNFYQKGDISTESMLACNDLIYMVVQPYGDGTLYFETPENNATFTGGVTHLESFAGRSGVISFDGTGEMNAGPHLMNNATGAMGAFTFATWMYIDEWTPDAVVFSKTVGENTISLQLGDAPEKLKFTVGTVVSDLIATGLEIGAWHYLGVSYASKAITLSIDATKTADAISNTGTLPFRASTLLGTNFKGKLDETFFSGIGFGNPAAYKDKELTFKGDWNATKTLAYWKYDDASDKGKDSQTWVEIMKDIRAKLGGKKILFRLGVAGGNWKNMCANSASITDFVRNMKSVMDKYDIDGADIDFEWPASDTDFTNVSNALIALKDGTGSRIISPTLHPLYYKISAEAISKMDWISIQCYGPSPDRYPVEQYKIDLQTVISNGGIPNEKIVAGLPFIGATSDKSTTQAYSSFVNGNLITSPDQNTVTYNGKEYLFDGQTNIKIKTRYARQQNMRGVMSWDLATDVPFTNSLSLLKAMKEAAAE
jgi:hypothetical protein